MKYQPSLLKHNDNVSHEHPLYEFFVLLLGMSLIIFFTLWALIFFVDSAIETISPDDEAKIYQNLANSFDLGFETESISVELQTLLNQLADCTDIPYPIKMRLVKSDTINALALPAGNILLFSGLLDSIKSENGLAFVLAHELGHFINRDHLRGIGRGIVLVAVSVLLTGANSDISKLLASTSGLGSAQYSQKAESNADKMALQILNCHYGHVAGATEFFESLLQQTTKTYEISHYFDSHPQAEIRITAVNEYAKNKSFNFNGQLLPKKNVINF